MWIRRLIPIAIPLVLACGFAKVAECNKLIQAATDRQERIKAASAKLSSNQGDIESLATAMEDAAKALGTVEVKDDKLKGFRDQYRDTLNKAAQDCRDLLAAQKENNLASINKAQAALMDVGPEESKIISGINAYCTGP